MATKEQIYRDLDHPDIEIVNLPDRPDGFEAVLEIAAHEERARRLLPLDDYDITTKPLYDYEEGITHTAVRPK